MVKVVFELKEIDVSDIHPNPNNPRGPFVRENDDQFQYLKRSIKEFGLIVPIVVQISEYPDQNKKYMLLDGERRLLALKELGIKRVPAHVVKGKINLDLGKTLMFHIHTNRVQWDAYQQCKALQPLYDRLSEEYNNNESNIEKSLIILTGMNKRTLNSRMNFLRWPEEIKKIVYSKKPELYYSIVEIESQIIIPALKNFPAYFEKVNVNEVRKSLFKKYYQGVVHAAIEARKIAPIVKSTKDNKERYYFALKTFKKMVDDVTYTFDSAREDFSAQFPLLEDDITVSFSKYYNKFSRFYKSIENYDVSQVTSFPKREKQKFMLLLTELSSLINDYLTSLDDIEK